MKDLVKCECETMLELETVETYEDSSGEKQVYCKNCKRILPEDIMQRIVEDTEMEKHRRGLEYAVKEGRMTEDEAKKKMGANYTILFQVQVKRLIGDYLRTKTLTRQVINGNTADDVTENKSLQMIENYQKFLKENANVKIEELTEDELKEFLKFLA